VLKSAPYAKSLLVIRHAGFASDGFVREDGLIGALAKWDLTGKHEVDDERVLPVDRARSRSGRLPSDAHGWRQYFRRRVRYSVGHFETAMLRRVLKTGGASAMPRTVEELYALSPSPTVAWRGIDTPFDWIAARHIRKEREGAQCQQHPPA
jgi:hypothetical protein